MPLGCVSIAGKNTLAATIGEQDHGKAATPPDFLRDARRARRMTGNRKPAGAGLLDQNTFDIGGRDMALDPIAVDQGGVARAQRGRHAKPDLDPLHIIDGMDSDLESVGFQVLGPAQTTSPVIRTIDGDFRRRCECGAARHSNRDAGEC